MKTTTRTLTATMPSGFKHTRTTSADYRFVSVCTSGPAFMVGRAGGWSKTAAGAIALGERGVEGGKSMTWTAFPVDVVGA